MYKYLLIIICILSFACGNGSEQSNGHLGKANKLIDQSSPYLLQHAYNPVDWYPWGDEAFKKAEDEDKLLIISIGYSACHWCHVMEHESFEDSLVARLMNDHFVSIKVDREERPDVDQIYMTACSLINGNSGWPLNAFALPNGKPIWAGTYFPKEEWSNILKRFKELQESDPVRLTESAQRLTEGIQSLDQLQINTSKLDFTNEELEAISDKFLSNIDLERGGRKGAPKFPLPNNYEFLMKYAELNPEAQAYKAYEVTLEKMARGGIFDHVGGGFARYSTDDVWLVPHFEKMLYDNAQLISLYSNAYKKNKKPLYKETVEKTIEFVAREMTDKSGGFYSALDADSEGIEGKFYVWDASEIDSILNDERVSNIYKAYYDISTEGNWEHKNILNRKIDEFEIEETYNISKPALDKLIKESNEKVLNHRNKRVKPGLDDKILASWNGLMLSAYIDAYEAFGEDEYLQRALKNAKFMLNTQTDKDHRLNRNYKDGTSSINAFLDDYASIIDAFVSLYQATLDEKWLQEANNYLRYSIAHFYNEESKMFRYTSDIDPPLVAQQTEYSDNVIPSPNSMMARNLFTIGTLMFNTEYMDMSKQMLKNIYPQIIETDSPNFYSNWLQLYYDHANPPFEIAILGPKANELRKEMSSHYLSNALLLGGDNEGSLVLLENKLQEGETFIYVCQNKVCKFPVQTSEKALSLLEY